MDDILGEIEPKIQALIHEVTECNKCTTMEKHLQFPLSAHGNTATSSILISEAPGRISIQNNKYWTGRGGQLLRQALAEVTTEQLEEIFYLTDIVKCWPSNQGNNRPPQRTEVENCTPFLKREIETIKPKIVILLGRAAYENTKSILLPPEFINQSITMAHNSFIQQNGMTIIPFLHPSNINFHMDVQQYKKQMRDLFQFVIKERSK